jgi:hypothetical protein
MLGWGGAGGTVTARPPARQVFPNLHLQAKKPGALPAAPGAANPRFPRARLSSGQRNQPSQARTGPAQPARPLQPLDPRQRGWAWAPAATAPPTRTREESEPHPLRRLRTYLQGTAGLLDSGHGPEGRSRGGRNLSQGPQVALGAWDGAGRGETLGALPRARVACRGGRGDLALPLAPGHRRRRHFAFHFVSPPPHSAVGFPDVGISRRRLRGG